MDEILREPAAEADAVEALEDGNIAIYPNTATDPSMILSYVYHAVYAEWAITKGNIAAEITIPHSADYDPDSPPYGRITFRDGSYFQCDVFIDFFDEPSDDVVESITADWYFMLKDPEAGTFTKIDLGFIGSIRLKHIVIPNSEPAFYYLKAGNKLEYGLMIWDSPSVTGKIRQYLMCKSWGDDNQFTYDAYWNVLTENLMTDTLVGTLYLNEFTQPLYDYLAGYAAEHIDYPGSPTGEGGGNGTQIWPDGDILGGHLPTINPLELGFVKLYNPSEAQVRSMSDWLWSADFDSNIMKNAAAPLDNIISLSLVPINIETQTVENLIVGNVESNIGMNKIENPFGSFECGELDIDEGYGGFLDYDVNMTLFLPFIGYRSIMADDVMNGKISIKYSYDLISGLVISEVFAIKRNIKDGNIYKKLINEYSGNMLYQIPFSGANFMSMYNQQLQATVAGNQNFLSQIGNAVSAGANLAAGNVLGAFGNALSIFSGNDQQKLIDRQYETAKPEYGRGGTIGGSSGLFSKRKPYLISSIPLNKVPGDLDNLNVYNELLGIPSEGWYKLEDLQGYTEVKEAKINFKCEDDEAAEILQLLKSGVYL